MIEPLLTIAFALAAFIYASVGHAGASGYLLVMALLGLAPEIMRPTALLLNLVVAPIALFCFVRAGAFSWRVLLPFALGALPTAFLAGSVIPPAFLFKVLVALVLLAAACRLLLRPARSDVDPHPPPWSAGMGLGALIGAVSGLTGTGGGVFLSPILVHFGWAGIRGSGGVAAAFILGNSLAGLAGLWHGPGLDNLPMHLPYWMAAVAAAGSAGAWFGSCRASPALFCRLLATVLIIAGCKLACSGTAAIETPDRSTLPPCAGLPATPPVDAGRLPFSPPPPPGG